MNMQTPIIKGQRVQVKEDRFPLPPLIKVVGNPLSFKLLRGMGAEVKAVTVGGIEVLLDSVTSPQSPNTGTLYPKASPPVTIIVKTDAFWNVFTKPTLSGMTSLLNRPR